MMINSDNPQVQLTDVADFERIAALEQRFAKLMQEAREVLQEWHFERSGQLVLATNPTVTMRALARLILASGVESGQPQALFAEVRSKAAKLPVFRAYAKG